MTLMTGYTFTFPLKHSEIVALAIRNWPTPCVVRIIKPHPLDYYDLRGNVRNKPHGRKHVKKTNRKRSRRHRP